MNKRIREMWNQDDGGKDPAPAPKTWLGRMWEKKRDAVVLVILCILFIGILLAPVLLFFM